MTRSEFIALKVGDVLLTTLATTHLRTVTYAGRYDGEPRIKISESKCWWYPWESPEWCKVVPFGTIESNGSRVVKQGDPTHAIF